MKLKILIATLSLIIIGGCVSSNKFIGNTVADDLLRSDILADIRKAERYTYNCRDISGNIYTEVKNIQKTGNPNQPIIADEVWRITACGKTHYYPINMRSDAKGETDYTVGIGKTIQRDNDLK